MKANSSKCHKYDKLGLAEIVGKWPALACILASTLYGQELRAK